jgi:hypothetical protein
MAPIRDQSHPRAHFVRPSGNSIRNDPIDSNDGEQQRDRGKTKNRGPVEFRPSERVKHPLLHGFYAEHRNLRGYRLSFRFGPWRIAAAPQNP